MGTREVIYHVKKLVEEGKRGLLRYAQASFLAQCPNSGALSNDRATPIALF